MPDIERAIGMALAAHIGQKDKAGKPYILHPLRVAAAFEDDETMYAAAILHDAVEDTVESPHPIRIEEILEAFGPQVAFLVDCLTRRRAGMLPLMSTTPQEKDELYLGEYIPRIKQNERATKIKLADLYDNLNPRRLVSLNGEELGRVSRYHKALQILLGGAHGTTGSERNASAND